MQSFVIVVSQIFLKTAIDDRDVIRKMVEALFLECPIEPFNMSVVIRLADPRVAMLFLHLFHEPHAELGAMV